MEWEALARCFLRAWGQARPTFGGLGLGVVWPIWAFILSLFLFYFIVVIFVGNGNSAGNLAHRTSATFRLSTRDMTLAIKTRIVMEI